MPNCFISAAGNVPPDGSVQFPAPRQARVQVSANDDDGGRDKNDDDDGDKDEECSDKNGDFLDIAI